MNGPKEDAYDEGISPLVREILRICRERRINVAMYFALDSVGEGTGIVQCRTVTMNDTEDLVGCSTLVEIHKAINRHVIEPESGAPAAPGSVN